MNPNAEIDEVLTELGNIEPPAGLARRVAHRLEREMVVPQRPWFQITLFRITLPRALGAGAIAAGVAASALVLDPPLRNYLLPHHSGQSTQQAVPPRVGPTQGGFGSAGKVVVPITPVQVPPSPVNHGRGHSRSGRVELPPGSQTALPRGVAAPAAPPAQ